MIPSINFDMLICDTGFAEVVEMKFYSLIAGMGLSVIYRT
jgi:hypothetical protein